MHLRTLRASVVNFPPEPCSHRENGNDNVKVMTWIVSDSEHLGGRPRVRGTRIAVSLLLEWLAAGMTIAEIVAEYPTLTEESIRGTLTELAQSDMLAERENPS